MDRRLTLQTELEQILGSRNVYFQTPESLKMKYPCIKYNKEKPDVLRADNKRYLKKGHYSLIVIDTDPETQIPDRLADHFEYCEIQRYYTSDNLTHCALDLYF